MNFSSTRPKLFQQDHNINFGLVFKVTFFQTKKLSWFYGKLILWEFILWPYESWSGGNWSHENWSHENWSHENWSRERKPVECPGPAIAHSGESECEGLLPFCSGTCLYYFMLLWTDGIWYDHVYYVPQSLLNRDSWSWSQHWAFDLKWNWLAFWSVANILKWRWTQVGMVAWFSEKIMNVWRFYTFMLYHIHIDWLLTMKNCTLFITHWSCAM